MERWFLGNSRNCSSYRPSHLWAVHAVMQGGGVMTVETFPPLTVEILPNGNLRLEDPTETSSCYTVIIDLHPAQVRHLGERLGLIVQSGTECPIGKSSAELQRENDRLRRQHLRLREHMLSLQIDFARHADHQHADLSAEMLRINAVVDLMDLVCADFADDDTAHAPAVAGNEGTAGSGHATSRQVTPADPSPKPSALQLEIL